MFKIIFFGTSEFAVPSLKALADDGRFEILGTVTQPDRPVGRHAVLTPPAVKAATPDGIPVFQPEKLKDESFKSWISDIGPSCDAFVIVSYGKILPQWLLDLPKKGIVNVHGSLLPRWRGASPIQSAIAANDPVSGVTIMLIDAEMDHGPILSQIEEPILPDDTGGELHDRLATIGGETLPDVLADYLDGKIQPRAQKHEDATNCRTLTRDDGKLDPNKTAEDLEQLVFAYNPWPGTWIEIGGKRIKILAAMDGDADKTRKPGDRFVRDGIPCLACADGTVLEIKRLQPEGRNAMSGQEYLRGKYSW
ncbi:MAG: methionyl-tRNA formyltransferase [Patescibacteria group bacterium]